MKQLITLILLCNSLIGYTQKTTTSSKKAENRLNISYTGQLYLNQSGVQNDGNDPDVISTKNTMGSVVSLEYERVTSKNIILNVGFLYGRQNHNVDVTYKNLSFFDRSNTAYLGQISDGMNYKANVGYIGMKFMAGYRFIEPISFMKGWDLEAKLGFSFRISTTESAENISWRINYDKNDTLFITHFGQDVVTFGKKSRFGSMAWSHNADLYLGLSKPLNWRIFKNIAIGLSLTHAVGKNKGIGSVEAISNDLRQTIVSEDKYRSQDFSLGLRLAFGLWYR